MNLAIFAWRLFFAGLQPACTAPRYHRGTRGRYLATPNDLARRTRRADHLRQCLGLQQNHPTRLQLDPPALFPIAQLSVRSLARHADDLAELALRDQNLMITGIGA